MTEFRTLFDQLALNRNWAEVTIHALKKDLSKKNCSLISNNISSTQNTALIAALIKENLLHFFADNVQGWIQMMLNSLNKDQSSPENLKILVNLLCECQKQTITLNYTMVGKTFNLIIRLMKKNVSYSLLENLRSLLIVFPNPSKPYVKELEEMLHNQLIFLPSENIFVLIIENILCISKLEGKNIRVLSTQKFLEKICNTCQFLLGQLTGEKIKFDADENIDRFPLPTLLPDLHSRFPGIIRHIEIFSLAIITLINSPVEISIDMLQIVNWIVRVYSLDSSNILIASLIPNIMSKTDELVIKLTERLAHNSQPFNFMLAKACIASMNRPKAASRSAWLMIHKCLMNNIFQKYQIELILKMAINDLKAFEKTFYSSKEGDEFQIAIEILKIFEYEPSEPFHLDFIGMLIKMLLHLTMNKSTQTELIVRIMGALSAIAFNTLDSQIIGILSKVCCNGLFHSAIEVRRLSKDFFQKLKPIVHPRYRPSPISKNESRKSTLRNSLLSAMIQAKELEQGSATDKDANVPKFSDTSESKSFHTSEAVVEQLETDLSNNIGKNNEERKHELAQDENFNISQIETKDSIQALTNIISKNQVISDSHLELTTDDANENHDVSTHENQLEKLTVDSLDIPGISNDLSNSKRKNRPADSFEPVQKKIIIDSKSAQDDAVEFLENDDDESIPDINISEFEFE